MNQDYRLYSRVNSNDSVSQRGKGMLKISEFAKACGCKEYTLRYYDKIGLIKPAICEPSGYRFYEHSQTEEYHRIKRLQYVGFSIEEIQELKRLQKETVLEKIDEKIKKCDSIHIELLAIRKEWEE